MERLGKRDRTRKALIVAGQRLMLPFLADVLRNAGLGAIITYRFASPNTVRRAHPDLVVLDADAGGSRPLELIRRTRQHTSARIVVITRTDDPAWNAVARAFGADTILGPCADRHDLFTAVTAV